jgi:hypothetical protein
VRKEQDLISSCLLATLPASQIFFKEEKKPISVSFATLQTTTS